MNDFCKRSIVLRGHKIETLNKEILIGGQVRPCYGSGWGFASFNQLWALRERIEKAIATAKAIGEDGFFLAMGKSCFW